MLIFSYIFWGFMLISSMILFPVALVIWLVTVLFDRRLVALHMFTSFWASLYTWLNPLWSVAIEGREKIRPDEAYIMMSNHQSLLDILVLFRLFAHFKWVSKIENFRVPFIGWNMRLNRYIELRRGSVKSNAQMMKDSRRTLESGSSVYIFPEGTRSLTDKPGQFRMGAFELAIRAKKPILPIVMSGTASALPKRGVVLQGKHAIRIRVLDPIPAASFEGKTAVHLKNELHELISVELEKLQAEASN